MITLYDYELSGNCYKVRLLLGLLGLEWKTAVSTSIPGGSTRARGFSASIRSARFPSSRTAI